MIDTKDNIINDAISKHYQYERKIIAIESAICTLIGMCFLTLLYCAFGAF